MTGEKRSKFRRDHDRMEIAKRYLCGEFQGVIAHGLGISQQTVSIEVRRIQDEWRQSALFDFNEAKQKELAKIDELERTYWEGWEKSREPRQTTNTGKRGAVTMANIKREESVGNPQFLAGVEKCIERRCKLLGLDAPLQSEVVGKGLMITELVVNRVGEG